MEMSDEIIRKAVLNKKINPIYLRMADVLIDLSFFQTGFIYHIFD